MIDFHAHLARADGGPPPGPGALFDVDGYLERQAGAGIDLTVLSHALSQLRGSPEELEQARRQHDFLAGLLERWPGRLSALAGLDPFGGEAWLAEAERALDAGFAGLCLPTSRGGRYLDAPEAREAFALADERGAVVFLHPSDSPVGVPAFGDPLLAVWAGRTYDTGICLCRLVLADTLAAFPRVRMVAAHSGGPLPMLVGRLDQLDVVMRRRASRAGGDGPPPGGPGRRGGPPDGAAGGVPLRPALEGPSPSERLSWLHLDTASLHPAGIRASLEAVGSERVVLGTDFPPAGDSPGPAVELVKGLPIPAEERENILHRNARRLLLPADEAQPQRRVPGGPERSAR